jgi:hypothetical protein
MPLEVWNTIFAGATFVVIAATAIAAVIQLRHLRSGNQLNALLTLMQMWDTPEMQRHIQYTRTELPEKLKDPAVLAEYEAGGLSRADHPEMLVADFWEQIGTFAKWQLVDERSWLDILADQVVAAWRLLEVPITAMRARAGLSAFENFEYLAARATLWKRRYPDGAYPKGTPRMAELDAAAATRGQT